MYSSCLSKYVIGESNSRSDFVVNEYGAIVAPDRALSMDVKPEHLLPLNIKISQKQVARILRFSSLDVTGKNYSRSDFAINPNKWIYCSV